MAIPMPVTQVLPDKRTRAFREVTAKYLLRRVVELVTVASKFTPG